MSRNASASTGGLQQRGTRAPGMRGSGVRVSGVCVGRVRCQWRTKAAWGGGGSDCCAVQHVGSGWAALWAWRGPLHCACSATVSPLLQLPSSLLAACMRCCHASQCRLEAPATALRVRATQCTALLRRCCSTLRTRLRDAATSPLAPSCKLSKLALALALEPPALAHASRAASEWLLLLLALRCIPWHQTRTPCQSPASPRPALSCALTRHRLACQSR